jgi:Protein of unknown function (DUF1360)
MDHWPIGFRFVLEALAIWRLSHLIAREDGPFDVIVRLRALVGAGVLGQLMDCPYCLSLWLAAPLAFFAESSWPARVLTWLALSAVASIVERTLSALESWRQGTDNSPQ